jgi:predicted Zn-ribbon and HTH transcriptional regulator
MTRFVIHNHLPAQRALDETPDPDAERILSKAKSASSPVQRKLFMGDLRRYLTKKYGLEDGMLRYSKLTGSTTFMRPGRGDESGHRDFRGVDAEEKCPRCKGSGSIKIKGMPRPEKCPKCAGIGKVSADRDFRGVVNRDQEERNRQESYDRHGIRRV